ncbi:MAG TPA: ATPase P [Candidatus Dormibacteraeota bacterium]|nr:ATPase P [Candidatus Dormibacteraeota bacterium]
MRSYDVPGGQRLELDHLVLDLNGTLSERGSLIAGVEERLRRLSVDLDLHLVTADTRGTAARLAAELPVSISPITRGSEKAAYVQRLGAGRTAAIGNGRNDEAMLRTAALGIAVVGPEGAATAALLAADLVTNSVVDALDLLLDPATLASTLRP